MPDIFKMTLPDWLSYTLSITGIASLAGAAWLYVYQCSLIYPSNFPEGSRTEVDKPSRYGLPYTEETLITKDRVKLRAYVMMQEDPEEAKRAPTILFFHANAGNMGHRLPIAQQFYIRSKCNVVLLSYRGYGLSEGTADEKGLRIDAQTLLDFVLNHPVLKESRLVAYGQSIGGAVAIDLVSRQEGVFSGLIVENTFLSLPKLIPSVMPMLRHFTFLCHQHWPSETSIQRITNTPILFLSGAKDELVPPHHMSELHERSTTRAEKIFKAFNMGKHNDTCTQPGYFPAIDEFLRTHVARGPESEKAEIPSGEEKAGLRPKDESYQLLKSVIYDEEDEDEGVRLRSFRVEEVELEED